MTTHPVKRITSCHVTATAVIILEILRDDSVQFKRALCCNFLMYEINYLLNLLPVCRLSKYPLLSMVFII